MVLHMLPRPQTPLSVDPSHLLLSVPKKGRLHEPSVQLLREIGLHFKRSTRSDIAHCTSAPVSLVFLNVADIPMFVAEGTVDAGIVGQDVIAETGHQLPDGLLLGFGKCVLALQAPSHLQWTPEDLIGKRVVTSFPGLTRKYFATLEEEFKKPKHYNSYEDGCTDTPMVENGPGCARGSRAVSTCSTTPATADRAAAPIAASTAILSSTTTVDGCRDDDCATRVLTLTGSVEASISLGVGEGIVDLVETGDTMKMAGLQQIAEVMKSEAVFVSNPHTQHSAWLSIIKKRIEGYLTAQKYQMVTYNIRRDKLQQAAALTPGLRSPTINSLADPDWVSLTAVVERSITLTVIDELDLLHAQDILVYDFRHCRVGSFQ